MKEQYKTEGSCSELQKNKKKDKPFFRLYLIKNDIEEEK